MLRVPFNPDALTKFNKIRKDIKDVFNGSCLLFLQQLTCMVLYDRVSKSEVRHNKERFDQGDWIRITTEEGGRGRVAQRSESFWYVKSKAFKPQVLRGKELELRKLTQLSIAVRFKMNTNEDESSKVEKELILDTSESLCNIYAYLPTEIAIFNFVLQGDFFLVASRESLVGNSRNTHLLSEVPDLFVQVFMEIAASVRASVQSIQSVQGVSNDVTAVSSPALPLPASDYSIRLTATDLLSLLPKTSPLGKYKELTQTIYSKLKRERFLKSSSGLFCMPSQLMVVPFRNLNPSEYISEDLLFECTGKMYLDPTDPIALELGEELIANLGIASFDYVVIVTCIECKLKSNTLSVGDLSGMLLALENLYGTQSLSTKQSASSQLIPAQLIRKNIRTRGYNGTDSGHKTKRSLTLAQCDRLRQLKIWPVIARTQDLDSMVSLKSQVVFMHGLEPSFSHQKRICFDLIPAHLVALLDESLFECASQKFGHGATANLRTFLLQNFSSSSSFDSPSTGEIRGGLEKLSEHAIYRNVILPMYATIPLGNSTAENRVALCASLAFIYLSDVIDSEGKAARGSIVIPLMTCKEDNSNKLIWNTSKFQSVSVTACRDCYDVEEKNEVHLGIEFEESAACRLGSISMKTLLRQVGTNSCCCSFH